MNRTIVRLGGFAWWLLPLALIAAVIGLETDWGRRLNPVPPAAEPVVPKPVVASVLPDFALEGGLAARSETTGRTLFNPTRRPAPTPVVEAPKPTIKRGQFVLTGTLVVDGKSTAFLREVAGGKSRRAIQGETVNGLLVAEVKPDRVRLALGDESEELVLKVQTNPKPTVAAVPANPIAVAAGVPGAAMPPVPPQGVVPPPAVTAPVAAGAMPATQSPGDLLARRRAAREAAAARAGAVPPQSTVTPEEQWDQVYRQRYGTQGN
jgi:hypothetical protein